MRLYARGKAESASRPHSQAMTWTWRDAILAALATAIPSLAFILLLLAILSPPKAHGRDLDGKYKESPLKSWFDGLKNAAGGLCCSVADGRSVADPDVEMNPDGYRVRVDGVWYDVPPEALVTVPNRFGHAVVWPWVNSDGQTTIRCFMPGAGA